MIFPFAYSYLSSQSLCTEDYNVAIGGSAFMSSEHGYLCRVLFVRVKPGNRSARKFHRPCSCVVCAEFSDKVSVNLKTVVSAELIAAHPQTEGATVKIHGNTVAGFCAHFKLCGIGALIDRMSNIIFTY